MGGVEAQTRTPTGLRSTSTFPNLSGLYIGPRAGMGFYGGDAEAANIRRSNRPGYGAELSWQAGAHFALVADYFTARYPRIEAEPTLQTLRLLTRYTLTHGWFDPYLVVGGHATLGGVEDAYGPVGGMGISIRLAPWLHLYNEISVNFSFPDRALDNQVGGSGFDLTGGVSLGFRIRGLGGGTTPPRRPPVVATTTAPPAEPAPVPADPAPATPTPTNPVVDDAVDLPEPAPLQAGYTWVVASFPNPGAAEAALDAYRTQGYEGQVVPGRAGGRLLYRVALGRYRDREEAGLVRANLPHGTWLLYTAFDAAPEPAPAETEPEPEPMVPEPVAADPEPTPAQSVPTSQAANTVPVEAVPDPAPVEPEPASVTTAPQTALMEPVPDPEPVTPEPEPEPVAVDPAPETNPNPSLNPTALPGDPVPDPPGLPPPARQATDDGTFYTLVVAALTDVDRAEAELRAYKARGYDGQVLNVMRNGQPTYRVTLGWYPSRAAAEAARSTLRADNWILAVSGPAPAEAAEPAPARSTPEPTQREKRPAFEDGYYTWVVGVFGERGKAAEVLTGYTDDGYIGQLVEAQKDGQTLYRVTLGRYGSPGAAQTRAAIARLPALPDAAWVLYVEQ